MQLIDTHAHIYLPAFDADRAQVLERAVAQGVGLVLMPAIDAATHLQLLSVAAQWPKCRPMMGVHPCSVSETYTAELAVAENYLKDGKFVAVGEIGLDFYWDTTFKKQQVDAFETQIGWALQRDLPVVIHSRNATDACIAMVARFAGLRGVFHCFSGTIEQAVRIREMGFCLGIGGVVTYKNAGLDKVMEAVGLDDVLLETDAPYLAPVPHRGKRNECGYLLSVAEKLAALSGRAVADVAAITTQNAQRLFRLT